MTSKTVAALLADLEVTRSHSWARVSNDNPYSDYAEGVVMPSAGWGARVGAGCGAAVA
jgi:putative transposase